MSDTATRAEQRKQEVEDAVNRMIEDTIRQAGPINTLAWLAVVGGGFVLNLLLLLFISGG